MPAVFLQAFGTYSTQGLYYLTDFTGFSVAKTPTFE